MTLHDVAFNMAGQTAQSNQQPLDPPIAVDIRFLSGFHHRSLSRTLGTMSSKVVALGLQRRLADVSAAALIAQNPRLRLPRATESTDMYIPFLVDGFPIMDKRWRMGACVDAEFRRQLLP
ncbi:hypothetical protein H257_11170 [Aphanomyces astaci]|uniref:Uncharacterized protein n=1 Tax=Aphanomyces astaci TaxID=112090 RepID=W4G5A9_APHAT|nr:hypothetical protein H257_11170 [Aphanomyces astaci]ETV74219.1 hypothetical protein H257_11170 [Aphanomyces astaci]|eukprot:XP_009836325.1 hypothetical protein H257_11170 [Aphanomyces astaci]